jgi:hypothetical protein
LTEIASDLSAKRSKQYYQPKRNPCSGESKTRKPVRGLENWKKKGPKADPRRAESVNPWEQDQETNPQDMTGKPGGRPKTNPETKDPKNLKPVEQNNTGPENNMCTGGNQSDPAP